MRPPEASAPAEADAPQDDPEGLAPLAKAVWEDLRGALGERARLLALEARLAGLTFVQLVIYAVVVAVLVVTSWIGLMGGVVYGLTHGGLHWALALAIGVAINLAVAGLLVRAMLNLVERVGLPNSLRRLQKH